MAAVAKRSPQNAFLRALSNLTAAVKTTQPRKVQCFVGTEILLQ